MEVFHRTSPSDGLCLLLGAGGMRVGPQYQATVPDYDPGECVSVTFAEMVGRS